MGTLVINPKTQDVLGEFFDKTEAPAPHWRRTGIATRTIYIGQLRRYKLPIMDVYAEAHDMVTRDGDTNYGIRRYAVEHMPWYGVLAQQLYAFARPEVEKLQAMCEFDKLGLCPVCGTPSGGGYCRPCNNIDWWDDLYFLKKWLRTRKAAASEVKHAN